jgi:hypothetical protein
MKLKDYLYLSAIGLLVVLLITAFLRGNKWQRLYNESLKERKTEISKGLETTIKAVDDSLSKSVNLSITLKKENKTQDENLEKLLQTISDTSYTDAERLRFVAEYERKADSAAKYKDR